MTFYALERNRGPLLVAVGIFTAGLVGGAGFELVFGAVPTGATSGSQLPTGPTPPPQFFFLNNLRVVTIMVVAGAVTAGVLSVLILFHNGAAISGIVLAQSKVGSMLAPVLLVLPHSLIELPAVCIAGAAGIKIPYEFFRYMRGQKGYVLNTRELLDLFLLYGIAVVLLALAAVIESALTERVVRLVA